jgi:ribosomal protein L7/L12
MTTFREIEALIASDRKIAAIKEFRVLTGLGLKDAKDAVEHFQAHGRWPGGHVDGMGGAVAAAPVSVSQPAQSSPLPALEQLVAQGQLIHAIKDLRAATGWGLQDSKDAVDEYRARGAWPASVLAVFGGASPTPAPVAAPSASPAPPRSTGTVLQDPGAAAMLQALAQSFGHAPHVHLTVAARRFGHHGHLVMLRDRGCFVRQDHGQWTIDPVIIYDAVRHVEVAAGAPAVLYVSFAHLHERFELHAADADAALALFRVFAP